MTELRILDPVVEPELQKVRSLCAQYADVIIVDKDSYAVVKASWQTIRNQRLDWEKRVANALSQAKALMAEWKGGADQVTEALKATEGDLRSKMQQYDDDKKAEAERIERERHERFIAKTNRLFEAGFAYNGAYYVAGAVIVTPQQVEQATDDEFEAIRLKGKEEADKIKEALAEIARRKAEEAEAKEKVTSDPVPTAPFILPTPDDDIVLEFAQSAPRQADRPYRDPSFVAGFDACRRAVVQILQSPEKMTRTELLERIYDLVA